MRLLTVVQRLNAISEPWLGRMITSFGSECVGVAGRTVAEGGSSSLAQPFMRLRSRNLLHRVLPKSLRSYSPVRPAALLKRFAADIQADRILCHYGTVAVEYAEAWDLIDLPLFVHFHGFDLMFDLREQNEARKLVHPPEYRDQIVRLSKRATLIANSEFSRDRLIAAGVQPDKVKVNYLGVSPGEAPKKKLLKRPCILFVGRFVDCKGPDLTLQAFNLLRQSGVDASLTMIGDGPLHEKCLALAAESPFAPDIHLPGIESHESVQRRFTEATLFTMHSIKGAMSNQEEAFGVAFLDAMMHGLPVVSGRSGGVPEIITHEVNGYLFDSGDIEAHADSMARLITNPDLAYAMGNAGWELTTGKFSQENSTSGLRTILNSL